MSSVRPACLRSLLFLLAPALAAQPLTRVAATSLNVPANPPATSYATARVFPAFSFEQPISLVTPPGETRRLFVVEKPGRIWVIPDVAAANPTRTLFLDIASRVTVINNDQADERGLLALAFHPDYASNGQFFVYYTLTTTTGAGTGLHDRLARFRVSATDPNVADSNSEVPLFSQFDEARNHNGGQLLFGPDGYLYMSLGDEGGANDQYQNGQRIDRDFFSAVLRLDVDRRPGSLAPNSHPAVHANAYAIPPDNPFIGATTFNGLPINPAAVRTEFWAIGLRNPWRMSLDPFTGRIWLGDVGQEQIEEIDVIVRGGNYGWNFREASTRFGGRTPPAGATFVDPVWEYPHTQGVSVTGGIVVRSAKYPALHGRYLFADFVSGRLWALTPNDTNPESAVSAASVQLLATDGGISSFGVDPNNGDILVTDFFEGAIKRLVASPVAGSPAPPPLLSATGAFSDLASLTPAPGVVAYEPNASFWSDYARKRRWFALRDTTSRYGFSANANWSLPTGAVWVKHFDLDLTRGNPATARRIETRFLVKTATGIHGFTYRWNDAQTDATLVPDEGADFNFFVTENGIERAQTWRFPSRAECVICHSAAGGHALSFNTRQLNRDHAFPAGNANILTALAAAGYLDAAAPPEPATLPALTAPDNPAAPLESRIRAYLDVNCAQCHRPGGNALGSIDARATTPLSLAGLVNGPVLDNGGDPETRVIVPGEVHHSRLLHRLAGDFGASRMPPIASKERDRAAESLLAQWIAALAVPQPPSRLTNLAARAQALDASATFISGFVVAGGPKTLLIRGAGPALAGFGVANPLAQPVLTLFNGSQPIASNTRWTTAANSAAIRDAALRVGAFAFSESGADSALLATLAPGDYSAKLTAASNSSTGIGLVEIYDADTSSTPTSGRLINTSIRAQVGTGAQILIPGLVVGPGAAKTVLIRAVGPGLASFSVSGFLTRPMLTLFAGDEAFRTNTAWNTAPNAAEIRATAARIGAFALAEGSADSALLVTLSPGSYSLHLAGVNNTTGVALVEVYEVP
ncbi:MAG: PQQ-dependent sugar dehydrogenase [Opitutaceae bacterium]